MTNDKPSDPCKTILICTPPYQNSSAGIIVLHELCDALVNLGYVAHIILMDTSKPELFFYISDEPGLYGPDLKRVPIPPHLGEKWIWEVLDKGVSIYPEIISGNPLNANNVVRYFLNSDGVITGKMSSYQPKDFCLAFSKVFFKNPHAVLTKPVRGKYSNPIDAIPLNERTLNLTYFGKGPKYTPCIRVQNSILLTGDWPKTKIELAILLKHTRYLYCWDNQTSLITDAIYCGATIVLLQFAQANEENLNAGEFGPLPYLKGELNDNSITIIENPNYEQIKNSYIDRLKKYEEDWMVNTKRVFEGIFKYFGIN